MSEHPFDSLARTLAGGASRRGVLRAIGGAVLGSLVAAPAQAVLAAGNSTCAQFCASVFGANTPAANQCTSDAAHGKGLCSTCGPASPGGGVAPSAICCTRTSSGRCASYAGATCCRSGQICQNSTCITPCAPSGGTCGGNTSCCAGLACCNGTCLDPNTYATDANNCGSCGHKCPAGASCAAGLCQQQVGGLCDATTICIATTGGVHRGACCNGTCTDTFYDNNSCGTCGHSCAAGQGCCNGTCTDVNTTTNCGSCGTACTSTTVPHSTGQACSNGKCVATSCGTGYCLSSGSCVSSCPGCQTCSSGICVTRCAGCDAICTGSSCTCPPGTAAITTAGGSTTCLRPCDAFCASQACAPNTSQVLYCSSGFSGTSCTSDSDCPAGQFCIAGGICGLASC